MAEIRDILDGTSALSHKINVATMPAKGIRVKLQPEADVRAAMAEQNDLLSVDAFSADLHIARWQKDGIRVTGPVSAQITQACVATLEPVPDTIDIDLDAVFVPDTSKLARQHGQGEGNEMIVDPEGPDAPETFVPPWLDVGAIAEEFFVLEINPYPRAAGAGESADRIEDDGASDSQENPFAALKGLKDKL